WHLQLPGHTRVRHLSFSGALNVYGTYSRVRLPRCVTWMPFSSRSTERRTQANRREEGVKAGSISPEVRNHLAAHRHRWLSAVINDRAAREPTARDIRLRSYPLAA